MPFAAPRSVNPARLRRRCGPAVLLAVVAAVATAAESDPALSVSLPDLARTKTRWAASPWAALWGQPALKAVRAAGRSALADHLPAAFSDEALGSLRTLAIDGAAQPKGSGRWRLAVTAPGRGADLDALITGDPAAATGGPGWTWTRDGDQVSGVHGGALGASGMPLHAADADADLSLSVDLLGLFAQGDEQGSRDWFAAVGLTRAEYSALLTAEGVSDRIALPGFSPPLARLKTADFVGVPTQVLGVLAFAIDGARLAGMTRAIAATPEGGDALELYRETVQARLGEPEALAASLSGAVVAVATPGAPFPDLTVTVPTGDGWDRLVGLLLERAGATPPTGDDAVAVALPVTWPATIWVRRDGGRWSATTAAAPIPGPSAPAWPALVSDGDGAGCVAAIDLPALAAIAAGYLALAGRNEARPGVPLGRDIARALARSRLRVTASCHEDAQGAVISGHHALVAATLPFTAVIGAVAGVDRAVVGRREIAARVALAALVPAGADGVWPETAPTLDARPHPCRRLQGPWALYLRPDPERSSPDQPVAIIAPDYLGMDCLWLRRDGTIRGEPEDVVQPLWLRAQALAADPALRGADDWAAALDLARGERAARLAPAEFPDLNIRLGAPKKWQRKSPPQAPWTALWKRDEHLMAGLLAEQGTGQLDTAGLLEAMITARHSIDPTPQELWRGPWMVAGLPGERARLLFDNGKGMALRFDLTAAVADGFLYQWATWSDLTVDEADLRRESETVLDSMQLIEPGRRSPLMPAAVSPLGVVALRHSPIELDLTGMEWFPAAPAANANPFVEVRCRHPASGANAFVISTSLDGRDANERQIAAGLLTLIGVDAAIVAEGRAVTLPIGAGLEVRYGTGPEAKLPARGWALRCGDRALLVVVYGNGADLVPDEVGDELVARLRPGTAAEATGNRAADDAFAGGVGRFLTRNRRWREALPWLCAAGSGPKADVEDAANALQAFCHLESWTAGLEWFDAHATRVAEDLKVASYRPFLLARCDRDDEAAAAYHVVFAAGWSDADDFADYLAVLRRLSDPPRFASTLGEHPTLTGHPSVVRRRARFLVADGEVDAAAALLRDTHAPPDDATLAIALADIELDRGRPLQAREDLAPALLRLPRSAPLRHRDGIALYRLGRYREAQTAFRAALDLDPGLSAAQDFLAAIDRDLGKGDTSRIAAPLEPVGAIAAERMPTDGDATPGGSYLLRATAIAWNPQDGFRRSDRHVIAITDRAACEAFSTMRFSFDPAYEQFHVNHLIVRDESGDTIAEGGIEDWYVLDDHDGTMATTEKTVSLPVPGLRPGCRLECLITRRQYAPERPVFARVRLGTRRPVARASISIAAPVGALAFHAGGGLRMVNAGELTTVEALGLPATPGEWLIPIADADLPILWCGPAEGSWEALARDYLVDLEPYLGEDATVTAAARSAAGALGDRQARIDAVVNLVQRDIAYAAVEFGPRGRIPQPAVKTLEKRLGDCKDQSVLLQRLLAAVDVPAHLALVPVDGWLIEGIPDLNQFNHMVVAVPGPDGIAVIDPTATHLDPALIPYHLAGARLLMLDPAQPRLITAPAAGPGATTVQRVVHCATDGTLAVDEVAVLAGYPAASWRQSLTGLDADAVRSRIATTLGAQVAAVQRAEVAGLEQPRQALRLTLRYTLRQRLRSEGGMLVGVIPDLWANDRWRWSVLRGGDRRRPLALLLPDAVQVSTRVIAPDGEAVALRAPMAVAEDDPLLGFHEWRDGDELCQRIAPVVGTHDPGAYARWCDRVDAVLERMDLAVRISPPPP